MGASRRTLLVYALACLLLVACKSEGGGAQREGAGQQEEKAASPQAQLRELPPARFENPFDFVPDVFPREVFPRMERVKPEEPEKKEKQPTLAFRNPFTGTVFAVNPLTGEPIELTQEEPERKMGRLETDFDVENAVVQISDAERHTP